MPDENSDDKSLHDLIAEAVDADEATSETAEEAPAEAEEAEATEETPEGEDAPEQPVEGEEEASEEGSEDQAEDDTVDAPAHWALEDQEMFRGLDGKAQQFLLGRSKDMEAAHTKRSQEIAPLRTAMEEWKPYLESIKVTPELAFKTLISAEHTLRTGTEPQKRAALLKLASDYGISLEEPKANGAAQETDFLTADIQKAVQPLQAELGTIRDTIVKRDEEAKRAAAERSAEMVRQFRDAKTEAGTLAHPYFDEVQEKMTTLAQAEVVSGKTPDLQSLYDDAIKLVPSVWAKLQAAQQHAAKKQAQREQKEKVKKAKAASVSVTGESSAPQEQPKSLRATIEEAAAGSL